MIDFIFENIVEEKDSRTYRYFSGNEWKKSESGKTIDVYSPVDTSILGKIQSVTVNEINESILQAKEAQKKWEKHSLYQRTKMFHTVAHLIHEHQRELTELLILEIGKSRVESRSEINRSADLIHYFADEVQSLTGEYMKSDSFPGFGRDRMALVERVPHGIVLAIAPFNYPINLAVSKIVPALLMGNSVIFKPPTQGSIIGLHLTELFVRAGLPEHLLTCITGAGREIGDYLVSNTDVNMIAFTGSTSVGRAIATKTGMTPLLFECGGNNPAIVLPDCDGEKTAEELVKGAFSYAGQRCTGIKYVLCEEETMNALLPLIIKHVEEDIHMGDPTKDETKLVGPLINESAAKEVEDAVKDALVQGAELVYGGKRDGWYMEPTILKRVKPEMKAVKTEIFGPILSFILTKDVDEMISIINNSTYGLQASIFTNDEGKGLTLSKELNVGTIQLNGSPQRGPDHFPFMGIKDSGVGVQGVRYSLEAMSRLKSIVINNPQ